MPMHDWTKVAAGIYHAFHHHWISSISGALNAGLLAPDYYSLPEQITTDFGPDVLALHSRKDESNGKRSSKATAVLPRPRTRFTFESDEAFYRKKQKGVTIRHVSGDDIVAIVEIVSPGNKSGVKPFRDFVDKITELLDQSIHTLIVDPLPPGPRDPDGIHSAIWANVQASDQFQLPEDKPLTIVSYEAGSQTRAYIEPIAVGDLLPKMPLYLNADYYVMVPLETTYQTAFALLPQRWQSELQN